MVGGGARRGIGILLTAGLMRAERVFLAFALERLSREKLLCDNDTSMNRVSEFLADRREVVTAQGPILITVECQRYRAPPLGSSMRALGCVI